MVELIIKDPNGNVISSGNKFADVDAMDLWIKENKDASGWGDDHIFEYVPAAPGIRFNPVKGDLDAIKAKLAARAAAEADLKVLPDNPTAGQIAEAVKKLLVTGGIK